MKPHFAYRLERLPVPRASDLPGLRATVGFAQSLRLDVGHPDHLAPLLGFVRDQLAEVSRRARKRRAAQIGKPRLDLGICERGVDLLVAPVDPARAAAAILGAAYCCS